MDDAAEFCIVSLKQRGAGDTLLFWRPNAAGYTTDVDSAGRYSEAEARKYGCDTARAVPVAEVEAHTMRVVPAWDGPQAWCEGKGRRSAG